MQNPINTIITVESGSSFYLQEKWKVADDIDYVRLDDIATLKDGNPITEATTTPGDIQSRLRRTRINGSPFKSTIRASLRSPRLKTRNFVFL